MNYEVFSKDKSSVLLILCHLTKGLKLAKGQQGSCSQFLP